MRFLLFIQFSCLIGLVCAAISIECDVPFMFVWKKEVEELKTCEIFGGSMKGGRYKLIEDNLEFLDNDSTVKALYIHNTTNTKIPTNLNLHFKGLKNVRVENTDLQYLDKNVTSGLENVERLYLGKNKISSIATDAFGHGLKNLQILHLNNNNISFLNEITFKGLKSLEKISLSFNLLTEISSKLFSENIRLQEIHLRSNKLMSIDYNAFNHMSSLKTLDLRDNNCIDESTFPKNQRLVQILMHVCEKCSPSNIINGNEK